MKLRTVEQLRRILETRERPAGRQVALCHGVFDLTSFVHIEHFKFAKSLGNILIVSLTPDVALKKGPGRPIFPADIRAAHIEAISVVDYICINSRKDALDVIRALKPDFFCKGLDVYHHRSKAFKREIALVESYGGMVVFGPPIVEFHTSDIVAIARGETTYDQIIERRKTSALSGHEQARMASRPRSATHAGRMPGAHNR
jgi:bifunctional ADP-heptose synthase (sugar kinase/adenylyltransferase)